MENYIIFADSACDITPEKLNEWGVKYCCLTYVFDDSTKQYRDHELSSKDFYQKMRDGGVAKTSAVNVAGFKAVFSDELKNGNNILYLGFSSGLSTTYNSARLAAEELKEEYPERTIITVDTLSASAGYGLLLYLTVQKKNEGLSIEEVAKYAEDTKLHLCHWFTVDDLVYLKRGGRISAASAFVGGVLGIKPVLHMDNEGHLINMSKVRGRKTSIEALANKFGELAIDPTSGPIFVSHGDCVEDVNMLNDIMLKKYGVGIDLVVNVGAVIGSHSGPGTLALFFLGKER